MGFSLVFTEMEADVEFHLRYLFLILKAFNIVTNTYSKYNIHTQKKI